MSSVHVVRLRCSRCGRRAGWVDTGDDGLVLVAEHHVASPVYETSTTSWALDQLDGPVLWDCPSLRCEQEITVYASQARGWAAMVAPGKVADARVPQGHLAQR